MSVRERWSALQQTLLQPVETVTKSARLDIAGTGVDEIDPPEDLDELHEQYRNTGIVRSNINQFVSDVVEPGVRVEADSDATQDYFMGGDAAPSDTPEGGFIKNCFVLGGQKGQHFYPGLKSTITQRWTRGTVMVELLKEDKDDAKSEITGFYHIRPETITAQTYPYTNILIDPGDTDQDDVEITRRDEAAAYIQFDDQSILGRRLNGFDNEDRIPLSQNDVLKQVLDPDIGGDEVDEEGVFGTSIIESVSTDIEEYNEIKRDRAKAIKTKAYGLWDASFNIETHDVGNQIKVVDWDDGDIDDWVGEVDEMGPGDIVGHDGAIDFQRFPSEVPDLEGVLGHYVDDITSPLPAPKYAVGFEENINQFVSNQQETRYDKLIGEERRYQERSWTHAFRMVAERKGLNTEGLRVVIEPEEEESPVMSLDSDELERMNMFSTSVKDLVGEGSAPAYFSEEAITELMLQLPDDALPDRETEDIQLDEMDEQIQQQFEERFGPNQDQEQQDQQNQQPPEAAPDGGEEQTE